ncbi:hypothetical protein NPX13_g1964 [Xylaria arbuscula]|uniref:Heterokaryon incompatibility domain-containing protein n=1 Tax=Xylaria arbuscula TaxID=114810 RepID=A0A9W8NL18_9PEZI|nr:hypothetical protein NPX13_g1964 [Xylaria arbuscula]
MGLPGYDFREPAGYFQSPNKAPEAVQSRRCRFRRWLTPLLGNEAPPLCRVCRRRQIDFRPLMKEPPSAPRELVDNDDLYILEKHNAVHIDGFSWMKAKAARSECSLCELLYWSFNTARIMEARMSGPTPVPDIFNVTLRPRWDWLMLRDGRKGRLVHRYQAFVQFQPFEVEVLFDIRYESRPRFWTCRRGRCNSPSTFDTDVFKGWLERCDTSHIHAMVPTKLVSRMESIMSRGLFRVINTSTGFVKTLTTHANFVALSYVWGPAADQADYKPLENRPLSAHAPTIRDAAVLAGSLGFDWLWVDRICIDQTSESEKAVLIPYMKDIFAAAELTIAAACGDGAQSGLLGSPETPREAEKPLVSISSISLLPASLPLERYLDKSSWGKRGWTFEEYIFSKRLLFIFNTKVLFKCGLEFYHDELRGRHLMGPNLEGPDRGIFGDRRVGYTADLHMRIRHQPSNPAGLLDMETFMNTLEEYSQRALTYRSDKIAAFAGVILASVDGPMDEVSEQALLKHGHPLRFFEILLTWEHGTLGQWAPIPTKPFAPTWSWASASNNVTFYPVRNRLVSDPVPWFQYSLLLNNDILALPTDNNSIAKLTGSQLPNNLIANQPWMGTLSDELSVGYEPKSVGVCPAYNPLPLPELHMVTFLFDARLIYRERERSSMLPTQLMIPKDSTDIDAADLKWRTKLQYMSFDWSIHPRHQHRYFPEGVGSSIQPPETFAIITGRTYRYRPDDPLYYSLFIMLLGRTEKRNTYNRVGMCRIDNVKVGGFKELIATGEPRWQYIRIA